jgi:hypothetical protein
MGQQKPWEKYGSGAPSGPITLGTPSAESQYKGPTAAADLAAKQQEAQMRALQMQKLSQELQAANGGPPMDPTLDKLTGPDFLAKLRPADAATVKALASGRMAFPSGAALKSPYWQNMLNSVAHYDPEFDAINYQSRASTRKDFTSGKSSQNIKALNTALGHVGQLYDQIGGTASHGGFPLATTVNAIQNAYERSAGDSGVTKYDQTAGAVSSELTQVFRGSGGAEADVKRYLGELSSNASEEQKKEAIKNIAGLLNSRLQAIGDQYQKGMGTSAEPLKILDDHAQQVLGNIMGTGGPSGGGTPPAAPPPTAPPGGGPPGTRPLPPPGGPMADKSTKWYGGDQSTPDGVNIAAQRTRQVKDPIMVGASKHLAAMLADRRIPDAAIRDYAASLNASPASVEANLKFRRENPNYTGGYNTQSLQFKEVPVSVSQWLGNGLGSSVPGTAAIHGANAVSAGFLPELTGNAEMTRAGLAGTQQLHPGAALAGNLAGGTLAAAGAEAGAARMGLTGARAAMAGDLGYGALAGAGSNPNNRLGGAVFGGTAGLGGGMFGRGVTRGIGNAATGVRNEAVQVLRDRGVPMSFGQVVGQSGRLGGMVKGIEDRLAGFPIVGDAINARRTEGLKGFNTAAFNEGLAPIGAVGQNAVNGIGEQGIGSAQQAVSGAYGHALNGVDITPDAQFAQELQAVLHAGSAIPRTGPEFAHTVNTEIAPHFSQPNGAVTGPQIQDILQTVRGTNFGHDAMGASANGALGDVGDAVTGLVGRQEPGVIPRLQAANSGYRNLSILADAVGKGSNTSGLFTPAQLGTAVKSNATKFGGKIAAASETRPFFDLQRAGQDVLPSKVPDSGTAGRGALLSLLAAPTVGAGAGYAAGDTKTGGEVGIGTLLALAAGGSKPAQKLLTSIVLNRSKGMVSAGQAIGRAAPMGGMFGAGASTALLPDK